MLDAGALVKELQDMRDDGHLSDALFRYAVRAIEPADDRIAWVGVYKVADDGSELWLHNYMGPGTEHAKIPMGSGVSGRASADNSNLIVNDMSTEEEKYVSSEDVTSEMAVVIRAADEVFAVIKVESEEEEGFTEDDEIALQLVADKLAEQMMAERR